MPTDVITTRDIQVNLTPWLRLSSRALVMSNVYILGSPWESDAIKVTTAYYWHEYEIKVTLANYRKDFEKTDGYRKRGRLKHDLYASKDAIRTQWGGVIPKPKSFSFVVPQGMLDGVEVPEHCGIIEYVPREIRYFQIQSQRPAPTLQGATKLSQKQIFNLAVKASEKLQYPLTSETT